MFAETIFLWGVYFKTATHSAFRAHFMLRWYDAVSDRIFKPIAVSIFYPEQHHYDVTWNEHENLYI